MLHFMLCVAICCTAVFNLVSFKPSFNLPIKRKKNIGCIESTPPFLHALLLDKQTRVPHVASY